MKGKHIIIIHLVHVIPGQDQHAFRPLTLQDVDVLVDAVGSTTVPPVYVALLRRHAFNVLTQFVVEDTPPEPYVPIERYRSVLSQYIDLTDIRIEAV